MKKKIIPVVIVIIALLIGCVIKIRGSEKDG